MIFTEKLNDLLLPFLHKYYIYLMNPTNELTILMNQTNELTILIDKDVNLAAIDSVKPITKSNIDGITTTYVKSYTHPLNYIFDKCHIHIFNFNRPYFPSYFVPYTFMDTSIFDLISYNNLSPLNKLKLMQNITLEPETYSLYKQLIQTAIQKETFLIEYDKLIYNLNSMDKGQPGLFSDFDRSGSMASIDMINQFVPQLEDRIVNLIKE